MTKSIFSCLLILSSIAGVAQQKIKTLETSDTIVAAAVDRPGDFYLITKTGQIQKYDKDGRLVILYRHQGPPTLFDPRDGSRLFAYYRQTQHYDYYNPSFETVSSYHVDPVFAIDPWLICPSGDHKLWLLDKADQTLKRLNANHTEVEIEVVIDSALIKSASSFVSLRDYQGFVFALDPARGIYIFNSIGNHIRTIAETGIHSFNFLGRELYYFKDGSINFFDLFTTETRQLPVAFHAENILLTDERMMVVGLRAADIYEFRP